MKKICINCEKKQGFFSVNYKLQDGFICDDCISPFGFAHTDLNLVESATATGFLIKRTAAEVVAAMRGENELFAEIRNEIFSEAPPCVLFKFDGKMGEHSEDVYVYEDRMIIVIKGFADTKLGRKQIILPFTDIASVAIQKGKLAYKKEFMNFSLKDGSEVTIGYSNYLSKEPARLKEFVESRIS